MRKKSALFFIANAIVIFAMTSVIGACKKNAPAGPVSQPTKAQILVQAGEWVTTGGTLVAADGSSVTLDGNDPFLKTILLYNVTFYADGTAVDTNNPNGLTKNGLTWRLIGSNLLVNINFNNTDKVSAVITYLSLYKLVMEVTDFYVYNGVTYVKLIQTLSH